MKIKKSKKIFQWIDRYLFTKFSVKSGPFMFKSRGDWMFIDMNGDIIKLVIQVHILEIH